MVFFHRLQIKGCRRLHNTPICCFWLSLILATISSTVAVASSSVYSFPITIKPSCRDRCGNVSIPFPFGTSPDCYLSPSYLITCNHSRAFLKNSTIQITDISLDGQLTLLHFIAKDCYARNKTRVSYKDPQISLPIPFIVNSTANKFTIVGCDAYGFVYGKRLDRDYQTGCTAMCYTKDDLTEGSCTGLGCCQTSIPKQVWRVDLSLRSYQNYSDVWDFNNCSYAFLAKETAFNFSIQSLTALRDVKMLPMVADWGIGNGTCEEARANASTYACKSYNSSCYKPDNGYSYRCSCDKGYEGNPYLLDGCRDIDECNNENLSKCEKHCRNTPGGFECYCPKGYHGDGRTDGKGCIRGQSLTFKLAAGISLGAVVLLLSAYWFHFELSRRRLIKMRQKFFHQNGGLLLQEKLNTTGRSSDAVKIFSELELQKATDNFHKDMIIGQGGYGTVFKGTLPDNRVVAIKKSKLMDVSQVEQFINEVYVLSQINHRNVVKLVGCCLETMVPLLVYEFISCGTLFQHIHNEAKARYLSWDLRLKVATETAGVLSYLHSAASPPIIHRDVKSANILLDHTYTAKVSDFGASRLVPSDETELWTMVQGTFGYLDPEYMLTSQLTEKSDVYSFGVVLAELLTGMKALSYDRPEEDRSLGNLFLSAMKSERLFEILDSNLRRQENEQHVMKVALLARSCLKVRGDDRPSMKEIALELEGLLTEGKHHPWDLQATRYHEEEDMNSLLGDSGGSTISIGFDSLPAHSVGNVRNGR